MSDPMLNLPWHPHSSENIASSENWTLDLKFNYLNEQWLNLCCTDVVSPFSSESLVSLYQSHATQEEEGEASSSPLSTALDHLLNVYGHVLYQLSAEKNTQGKLLAQRAADHLDLDAMASKLATAQADIASLQDHLDGACNRASRVERLAASEKAAAKKQRVALETRVAQLSHLDAAYKATLRKKEGGYEKLLRQLSLTLKKSATGTEKHRALKLEVVLSPTTGSSHSNNVSSSDALSTLMMERADARASALVSENEALQQYQSEVEDTVEDLQAQVAQLMHQATSPCLLSSTPQHVPPSALNDLPESATLSERLQHVSQQVATLNAANASHMGPGSEQRTPEPYQLALLEAHSIIREQELLLHDSIEGVRVLEKDPTSELLKGIDTDDVETRCFGTNVGNSI